MSHSNVEIEDKTKQLALRKAVILKEAYKRDPYLWLIQCCKTWDEHDSVTPVKSFPDKPYLREIAKYCHNENIIHVAKSRQMLISWLIIALLLHEAEFFDYRLEAIFSKKEDDAFLLVERAKFIYSHQPVWLKNMCPLDRKMRDMPLGHLFFGNGSQIRGLAQGKDQIRSYVPTTVFIDEAAFQDKLEETYNACVPCAKKIITVSSAENGFFQRLVEL